MMVLKTEFQNPPFSKDSGDNSDRMKAATPIKATFAINTHIKTIDRGDFTILTLIHSRIFFILVPLKPAYRSSLMIAVNYDFTPLDEVYLG